VLVALLAALAVLVHHEAATMASPHGNDMSHMPMAVVAEPGADHLTSSAHAHPSRSETSSARAGAPAGHTDDATVCADGVAQHCGAAHIETVELSPPRGAFRVNAGTHLAVPRGPAIARCAERTPPELSALSHLRI
jgi:hypothetical protein